MSTMNLMEKLGSTMFQLAKVPHHYTQYMFFFVVIVHSE